MEVTILYYFLIVTGILGVTTALACFGFIFVKLKINHIIKKLLLFATIQQAIGYATFLCSVILYGNGFKNKLICFLILVSIRVSSHGTQASITAISIIRYLTIDTMQCQVGFNESKLILSLQYGKSCNISRITLLSSHHFLSATLSLVLRCRQCSVSWVH